jgi:hypothetical protein
MTREEFGVHIKRTRAAQKARGVDAEDMDATIYYSWDNAPANWRNEDMPSGGFDTACRLPLPPNSPDLHKVIEHCMAHIKGWLQRCVDEDPFKCTPAYLQEQAELAFKSITAESIRRDVASLPTTYAVVAGEEGETVPGLDGKDWDCTAGDWAPAGLR